MTQWISAKDRLPEDGAFLAFNDDKNYIQVLLRVNGTWWTDHDTTESDEDITHWLPLPEPPKGEEP